MSEQPDVKKKKKRNIPLKERCPKCQATKFAISNDINKLRYCTFSKEDGYDGIGAKGCGAIWQPLTQDQIKLDNMTRKHRDAVEVAKSAKDAFLAFERQTNGQPPGDIIVPMGELHSKIKHALDIIANSLYS